MLSRIEFLFKDHLNKDRKPKPKVKLNNKKVWVLDVIIVYHGILVLNNQDWKKDIKYHFRCYSYKNL